MASLVSVQVGKVAPLGPAGVSSAFVKRPVAGPVQVRSLGLVGDAQADLRVHGGEEKAVYAYAHAHYAHWLADFPEHAAEFTPGAFGENLTIDGLDEADMCAGDVHEIGGALLQACQPREPCFKFALRFNDERMPSAMMRTMRAGWYYRVLAEGDIRAADAVRLADRPHPNLPFQRLLAFAYKRPVSREELEAIAAAAGVATRLRDAARARLSR